MNLTGLLSEIQRSKVVLYEDNITGVSSFCAIFCMWSNIFDPRVREIKTWSKDNRHKGDRVKGNPDNM